MKIEHICAAAPGTRLIIKGHAGGSAGGKTRFRTVPVCAWANAQRWQADDFVLCAMTPGLGGVLVALDPNAVVAILMPGETLEAWANSSWRFFISESIEIADGAASAEGAR